MQFSAFFSLAISLTNLETPFYQISFQQEAKIMFAEGRIPLWIVATVAGLGVIVVVGTFFYGSYVGVGSAM